MTLHPVAGSRAVKSSAPRRTVRPLGAVLLAMALAPVGAAPPRAADFVVNTNIDAVDAHPGDKVCLTANGLCTLRAAIQEANALAGPDTISLPPGTYSLTIGGSDEDAAATGDLDITGDLTISEVSNAGGPTIVSGSMADRIFDIQSTAHVTISGIIIQGGAPPSGGGGAIRNAGTLALAAVAVTRNHAADGGGLLNFGT